ncbi:MAG: hypothetical protein ACOCWW_02160, partial [Bacteroidota bacterium]
PKLEKELKEEFERLEKANNELGNEKTNQQVNQLRSQVDEAIRKKDVKIGKELLEEINSLITALDYKKISPDILKEKLIELYSKHPEIPQDKFRAIFDELYSFSENNLLTKDNFQQLRAIDKEIDDLI